MADNIYGYVDESSSDLQSRGGQFGLNVGRITKLEFNPNAGSQGSAANAVDLTVTVQEKEYMSRIFENFKVYKGGQEINPGDKGYDDALNRERRQRQAVVIHVVKSLGVSDDDIKTAVEGGFNSFEEWAKVIIGLVPNDFDSINVHVFLEYQWNIKDGQDRTYLQLPSNMKGGKFLSPALAGNWEMIKDYDGLHYMNEEGTKHPFVRNKRYMDGNKANQQFSTAENASSIEGTGSSSKKTW